jgi:YgiT-type zinc finger domain-containing protein
MNWGISGRCSACKSARLARSRVERTVERGGAIVAGMVPALRCKTCGHVEIATETMREFEERAAAFTTSADGSGPFEMWRAPESGVPVPPRTERSRRASWVA